MLKDYNDLFSNLKFCNYLSVIELFIWKCSRVLPEELDYLVPTVIHRKLPYGEEIQAVSLFAMRVGYTSSCTVSNVPLQ